MDYDWADERAIEVIPLPLLLLFLLVFFVIFILPHVVEPFLRRPRH